MTTSETLPQGVTVPQGFSAASTTAGIKPSGNPDMALVVNQGPRFDAAAVFTRNRVVAAPVKVTQAALKDGNPNELKVAVFNAGNANACNGAQGMTDAKKMAEDTALALGVDVSDIAVCSTGLIGELMPMDKVHGGIDKLAKNLGTEQSHGAGAAAAIMTTDTVPKQTVVHGQGWTVGGMGKGVGMMAPSLATMLVCITTDAQASPAALDAALRKACDVTFNTLDVDGSTSTNDTVIVMANGASGVEPSQEELDEAILKACADLADQLQADAEGVTKRVKITVKGTGSDAQALMLRVPWAAITCLSVRCLAPTRTGAACLLPWAWRCGDGPDNISVFFNNQPVCVESTGAPGAREVDLSGADIDVLVDLGTGGEGTAFVRTTDLSHDYVEINSAYSS